MLDTGYWMLDTGYWELVAGRTIQLKTYNFQLTQNSTLNPYKPTAYRLLPIIPSPNIQRHAKKFHQYDGKQGRSHRHHTGFWQ